MYKALPHPLELSGHISKNIFLEPQKKVARPLPPPSPLHYVFQLQFLD